MKTTARGRVTGLGFIRFCCAAASAIVIASCMPPAVSPTPSASVIPPVAADINALADEYVREFFQTFPEFATLEGVPSADHGRLSDNSLAAVERWQQMENAWIARASALDASAIVGTPAYRTLRALTEQLEGSRGVRVCRNELWPVSPTFTGWQAIFPFLATIQPVGTNELRRAAVSRFGQLARYLDAEVANTRAGMAAGYLAPRTGVTSVIEQLDGLLAAPVEASPFVSPAQRDTTAPPSFRAELERIVREEINPAVRRQRDFLANEYLPVARTGIAVSETPGGEQCYRASVRGYTTLRLAPRAIHEVGLEEMAKIRSEMQTIARRSFGTDDVREALEKLRTDPAYTFGSRQEIIDYAQAALDRAKAALPQWFGILPSADVVIQPYPEFQEKAAPLGQYNSPSDDGTRPGIYLINTYEPEKQSKAGLESTAFHETYPGHHLQIAIAKERPGAHDFVRYFGTSGYVEGWALYTERLADEMGLFSSDVDRMGLLSNEALRAARLVVDAGMHALGWTRQQAIDYVLANTTESVSSTTAEVDRYIAVPGQATSYMLGNLEIRRLREQAERELGSRFDIRAFHDRVLEDGNVTLPMLRDKIERWIAASR